MDGYALRVRSLEAEHEIVASSVLNFSMMQPRVPYVPKPLPDEILGSWLARILFHNGGGTWRAVLNECGYGDRIGATYFDLVDYDEKIEKLLGFLGTSYERVIQDLTTLPYWLTFVSSSDPKPLPGTANIRMPVNSRGHTVDTLRSFGLKRRQGQATHPRFCPECLTHDQATYGEVYWHRSHQLPNVLFCPSHGCALHDQCPSCGVPATPRPAQLMPLPKLICECGYRLDAISSAQPAEAHLTLAKISAAALQVARPEWTREHVVLQFKGWFRGRLKREHGTYINLLKSTFEATSGGFGEKAEIPFTTKMTSERKSFFFRPAPASSSSPDFCALLVAMNRSLPEALSGFRQTCIDSEQKTATVPRTRNERASNKVSRSVTKRRLDRSQGQVARCLALTEAFHKIMSSSEMPSLIDVWSLGRLAGLSREQAALVISSFPFLRNAIAEANDSLYKRRILWAVSVLRSNGEKITKSAIREQVRFPNDRVADEIMQSFSIQRGVLKFESGQPNDFETTR